MPQHANATGTELHEGKRRKEPARAASTATVTTATPGASMDGVSLTSGDRVLLKDQSTASQNGIYVWTGAATPLTRSTDADSAADFVYGFDVFVREGTANAGKSWTHTTSAAITLGSTSLTFAQTPVTADVTARLLASAGTITDYVDMTDQGSDPSSPSAGRHRFYAKAGGLYVKDSSATVVGALAAGGGGGSLSAICALSHSSNQSITSGGTFFPVSFNTEVKDTDTQHFTSSAALTGTVTKASGLSTLAGSGTSFTSELTVGQVIEVPGTLTEIAVITVITSNVAATINGTWTASASGQTATRRNSGIVARTAGFYQIQYRIEFAANATGIREADLIFRSGGSNDSGYCIDTRPDPDVTQTTKLQGSHMHQMAQWDIVEVRVAQTSGGGLNVLSGGSTFLQTALFTT